MGFLISAPWWFCNGWWSPWCVIDVWAHKLGLPLQYDVDTDTDLPDRWWHWICRQHDKAVK